jgi:hypothetical protein
LAFVGELEFRQPITEVKLLIKSLKFIQMSNRIPSAGTNVESSTNVEVSTSSPNDAKPDVGRRFILLSRLLVFQFLRYLILLNPILLHYHNLLQFLYEHSQYRDLLLL